MAFVSLFWTKNEMSTGPVNLQLSLACLVKFLVTGALLFSPSAFASSTLDHNDPVASVILGVTGIFLFGVIGRYIALRLKQPGVLGELLMGVFLGNIAWFFGGQLVIVLREGSAIFTIMRELFQGNNLPEAVKMAVPDSFYADQVLAALSSPQGSDYFKIAYIVDIFSRYGVIFLLFMVGLESSVEELKHTGKEAIFVACIGVVAPMILGFTLSYFFMPEASFSADLFVGAALSATSIGITARVLKEMQVLHIREAKTILGAAMLDDILALILLAIVSGIVLTGSLDAFMLLRIVVMAILFFAMVLLICPWIIRKAIHLLRFLAIGEAKLIISFIFLMALAWFATMVQLATIIGAFAAGLVMHDEYFNARDENNSQETSIQSLISPLESILAPLFFMLIGIQVKLETFFNWQVLALALGLIIVAIAGKLIAGLGANARDNRLFIGIGMLPRGEVGLVFASIGRTLGVISDTLFSAIILMVMITTLITPPLLKWSYAKNKN